MALKERKFEERSAQARLPSDISLFNSTLQNPQEELVNKMGGPMSVSLNAYNESIKPPLPHPGAVLSVLSSYVALASEKERV